jgi:hypothetical protein
MKLDMYRASSYYNNKNNKNNNNNNNNNLAFCPKQVGVGG